MNWSGLYGLVRISLQKEGSILWSLADLECYENVVENWKDLKDECLKETEKNPLRRTGEKIFQIPTSSLDTSYFFAVPNVLTAI